MVLLVPAKLLSHRIMPLRTRRIRSQEQRNLGDVHTSTSYLHRGAHVDIFVVWTVMQNDKAVLLSQLGPLGFRLW